VNNEIKIIAEKILLYLQENNDYESNRKYIENELTIFRDGIRKVANDNRTDDRRNKNTASDRVVIGTCAIYSSENYFAPREKIGED